MTQIKKSFLISRFTNPSGDIVFRVSGRLVGDRIRKNFSSRAEADAECQSLELKKIQLESDTGLRPSITRLTDEQLQEAEAVFRRLQGSSHSLTFCVDYTCSNYRTPEREKMLSEAILEYLASKRREYERGLISEIQVGSIRKELSLLHKYFPSGTVSILTATKLIPFCDRGKVSLKTYNNRRGILSTFFRFAFLKDWTVSNPVEKVPYHRIAHRRGSARTLSAAQAAELMAFVEKHEGGRLVPFFALCLFAGIRPCVRNGEILKLKPDDVRLDTGVIHVEPEVSKVRMKRNVMIQPNLKAWLEAYPLKKFPIVPANLQHLRAAIAKRFGLSADVMRHTFISMFVAKYRSMGEAALQAGNSESIIRKHYLDLKSTSEAEEFFGIFPQRKASREIGVSTDLFPSSPILMQPRPAA